MREAESAVLDREASIDALIRAATDTCPFKAMASGDAGDQIDALHEQARKLMRQAMSALLDMCRDMRTKMCIGMCTDMFTDMCGCTCKDM